MARMILVVDDSPDDVEITRCLLEQISPETRFLAVEKGEAALALLAELPEPPAVILMDMRMPGMDGPDLLASMKSDTRLAEIPVIIVSHSSLEEDRRRALAAGARHFLHKSFDLDQFASNLRSLLGPWLTGLKIP